MKKGRRELCKRWRRLGDRGRKEEEEEKWREKDSEGGGHLGQLPLCQHALPLDNTHHYEAAMVHGGLRMVNRR